MPYREVEIAEDVSDRELVERVRDGASDAAHVLWERHARASRAAARRISRSFDSDDLVQEAFTRTLTAIRNGSGPTGPFRPYLYAAMRNIATSWARQGGAATVDEPPDTADPTSDFSAASLDKVLAARAFRTLPDEWRTVLWYADVEGMGANEIAPLVGLTPGAVASLTYRAREGLRRAWILAHLSDDPVGGDCAWAVERIPRLLRGSLSGAYADRMRDHLAGCARCALLVEELEDVAEQLRVLLLPLALGAGAMPLDDAAGADHAGEAAQGAASSSLPHPGGAASLGSNVRKASIGLLVSVSGIAAVAASAIGLWHLTADAPSGLVEDDGAGPLVIEASPPPHADTREPVRSPEPSPGPTTIPDEPPEDTDDAVPDTRAAEQAGPMGPTDPGADEPVPDEPGQAGPDAAGPGPSEPGPGEPGPDQPDTDESGPGEPRPGNPGPGASDPDEPDSDAPSLVVTDVVRDLLRPRVHGIALPGALVEAVTATGEVLGSAYADPDGTFVLVLELSSPTSDVLVRQVTGGRPQPSAISIGPVQVTGPGLDLLGVVDQM